jgi:hypothetical protein
MANMTDQTRVNALLNAYFKSSAAFTITPGTGGGSAFTITPPFNLRLMSAQGSNTSNGTEQANGNGYTTGGSTLGTTFAGTVASGAFSNANAVSWTATGTWSPATQTSIEIWDTAGTALRYLQGALTSSITGVANGDTVTFAAGSITVSAAAW